MPFYEYKCTKCGHAFERMMPMLAENPECPECGERVNKLVSLSDFKVKGQPPRRWKPRKKSEPKSHVRNLKYARRKQ